MRSKYLELFYERNETKEPQGVLLRYGDARKDIRAGGSILVRSESNRNTT